MPSSGIAGIRRQRGAVIFAVSLAASRPPGRRDSLVGKEILMPISMKRLGAAGLVAFCLIAGSDAFAQAKKRNPTNPAPAQPAPAQPAPGQAVPLQPPQGPVTVDLVPTQNDWTKVCDRDQAANKDVCYTTRDFSTKTGEPPVLALAVYEIKGEDTRSVRLLLPVGLMLRPGFRFTVDKGAEYDGAFEICFRNGCFAQATVNGAVIDGVKKGSTLSVAVKNQVNNLITFVIPLAGFAKAFDGPPIDPKVLEEQRKKFEEELQKRAEEERKRLEAAKPEANKPDAGKPASPAPAAK
jgi:invasion protein IalB